MKVVLSRKGFDSANGGIMSPVFEDGTMVSFPIPSKDVEKDNIRYDELFCDGICLKTILNALGYRGAEHCHLDPDLVKDRRRESIREWTPAFGQINQSATYLKNQHISEGDLFLFFGNFRHIKQSHGWCGHYDGNDPSRRVMEKCGFTFHHTETGKLSPLGDLRTEHFLRLTADEWRHRR